MPYFYTNRQGRTHYFRASKTKKGNTRYYVTTADKYSNLIDEVPEGFEVAELPYDGKVVIRKKIPILTTLEEKQIVYKAIKKYSGIKDFFIHAEQDYLYVYHSQFNYAGGQEPNLNREEAIELWGDTVMKWMKFDTALKFQLVDQEKRLFQAERLVYLGLFNNQFYKVGAPDLIKNLSKEIGQHLGKDSFFDTTPKL
ncbi:hypothetical protein BKI52_11010 [marine bacterium AO1-C]|nr:hypothetical protein BKI52_11010 [marine bacterium AO1-C]